MTNRLPLVGVLALQGDFPKHISKIGSLGVIAKEIRTAGELGGLDALIIPGGESTTLTKLLSPLFRASIEVFAQKHPVWGTCAGMIMVSKNADDPRVHTLGLMDLIVDRNGFGRQVHSFEADLKVSQELGEPERMLRGMFIRAPRVKKSESTVRELVWLENEPVCLRQGNILASSFHPELTDDDRMHRYFLAMIE